MVDGDTPSVEQLARMVGPAAIGAVTRDGMAEVFQMHADLVRAAGFRAAFEERKVSLGSQHAPSGLGFARVGAPADSHALAMDRVPCDGAVDDTGRGAGASAHDGEIRFARRAVGKLARESGVRGIIFRDEDATAGVLVETVDDAGAQDMTAGGNARAMVEDRVDQRALPVTRGGMDDEAGRLVQTKQVLVLVDDVEGNVLGRGQRRRFRRRWRRGLDVVSRGHGIGRTGDGVI